MTAHQLRLSVAMFVTLAGMMVSTLAIYADSRVMLQGIGVIAVIVVVGLVLRLRVPRWSRFSLLIWVGQAAAGLGTVALLHRGTLARGLSQMTREASSAVLENIAPLQGSPPVAVFVLVGAALFTLLTDLCIFAAREPALAIVPIGTWYSIVCLLPEHTAAWGTLAVAALGYVCILAADTLNRWGSWHRHIASDNRAGRGQASPWWLMALLISAPVLAATIPAAAQLPDAPTAPEREGNGGNVELTDPLLDLRRSLRSQEEYEVLRYRSDAGKSGVHLRLASLAVLTNQGWTAATIPVRNLPPQQFSLPTPPGLTVPLPKTPRTTNITVVRAAGAYLPLPWLPTQVRVGKEWSVDPDSLTVYTPSMDEDATRGLIYSVTSADLVPTTAQLASRRAGRPDDGSFGVPAGMPASVRELADSVTEGFSTPLGKAAALQNFLRSDEFTYDLTTTSELSGYRGLEDFLLNSRTGYCEQFAGAFAAMARTQGFASRVTIGYLPGVDTGDGVRSVSNQKMHAWPELYFEGWGWVRFEPTPGGVSGAAPAYTRNAERIQPTPSASPSASPSPTAKPTVAPTTQAPVQAEPASEPATVPVGVWVGLGVLLLAVLAAAPALIRVLRRRRRLAAPLDEVVTAAWEEIRDTAVDLGVEWPQDTPRAVVARLRDLVAPENRRALEALALAVERERFAPQAGTIPPGTAATVETVRRDLADTVSTTARWRALLLPRSLWERLISRMGASPESGESSPGSRGDSGGEGH